MEGAALSRTGRWRLPWRPRPAPNGPFFPRSGAGWPERLAQAASLGGLEGRFELLPGMFRRHLLVCWLGEVSLERRALGDRFVGLRRGPRAVCAYFDQVFHLCPGSQEPAGPAGEGDLPGG